MIKPTKPVQLLTRAIQIIIFVFGVFGGFILHVSPPDHSNGLPLANGIVQFGALIILLGAAAAVRSFMFTGKRIIAKTVKIWFCITAFFAILFITMGMVYYNHMTDYTVYNGKWEERFIKGTSLTPYSLGVCKKLNKLNLQECENFLFNNYYASHEIALENLLWETDGVNGHKKILFRDYIFMILSLCTALFSLVEYLTLRYGDTWAAEKTK